jgi:hypothetical protein
MVFVWGDRCRYHSLDLLVAPQGSGSFGGIFDLLCCFLAPAGTFGFLAPIPSIRVLFP